MSNIPDFLMNNVENINQYVVKLPSKGLFYDNKKDYVKVSRLTALDDTIITSPKLINSGKMTDKLLEKKLTESPVHFNKLLTGDKTKIIINLRANGIDRFYERTFVDPKTNKEFNYKVDLLSLKDKEIIHEIDNDNLFTLKLSSSTLKIKLLNTADRNKINEDNKLITLNSRDDTNQLTILTFRECIVSIDGNKDAAYINNFIDNMGIMDGRRIVKFLDEIEPGVDFNIKVETPSNEIIDATLELDISFFYPEF